MMKSQISKFYVHTAIESITIIEMQRADLFLKVQRLSREGVHYKLRVVEAVSMTISHYDIVWPIWKHIAASKVAGLGLRPSLNTSVIFGMSSNTFMDYAFTSFGVRFNEEEANRLRVAFFKLYPEAAKIHRDVWKNYKKPEFFVTTALGRRVKPRMGTDGINIPVQGTGAETTKLAIHYLIKDYPETLKYIFNVVHDSVYLRVPKDEGQKWEKILAEYMLKGWTEIQKTEMFIYKDIPMEVG